MGLKSLVVFPIFPSPTCRISHRQSPLLRKARVREFSKRPLNRVMFFKLCCHWRWIQCLHMSKKNVPLKTIESRRVLQTLLPMTLNTMSAHEYEVCTQATIEKWCNKHSLSQLQMSWWYILEKSFRVCKGNDKKKD